MTADSPDTPHTGPTELTLDEALRVAQAMHRGNAFDDAEKLYRRILHAAPEHPDALHFLGLLVRQQGRHDEALDLVRRAVVASPDYVSARVNLANLLFERRAFDAAARELEAAEALAPDDPLVANALGNVADALGREEEAARHYRRALELAADFAVPHQNLGGIAYRKGDIASAHDHFCRAVVLDPGLSFSRQFIGLALCHLGRHADARRYYQNWIAAEPDNPVPRHLLNTVAEGAVAARAADDYVRTVFDSFASTFDTHLERLEYKAPQLVADAVHATGDPRRDGLAVLDAGCGTGLCGPLLRSCAARLTGVDLSPGMLEKARPRGCYDELVEGELAAFMTAHPGEYDLIACADTLCYFGDLTAVMAAAAAALKPGGRFVFTVEEVDEAATGEQGYRVGYSGRYAHCERYVRAAVDQAGLVAASVRHEALRCEVAQPVAGLVVVAQRRHDGSTA